MKKRLFALLFLPVFSQAQMITTIAGVSSGGYSGDGGPATAAALYIPNQSAVDHLGNIYIADGDNYIRKINTAGIITTIAGTGTAAHSGDNGPATAAEISGPTSIAADRRGNVYFTESGYLFNYIRRIDASGLMTTIAGTGAPGYSGDNGPATAAAFDTPEGIATDTAGNLFFADQNNNVVRKVDIATGFISTVAGNGTTGALSGDGGPATAATISLPWGVAADQKGNIYVTDDNERIRKISASGIITSIAGSGGPGGGYSGDGGPATNAVMYKPHSLAVDSFGAVYFDDQFFLIRKVDTNGVINTVAGNFSLGLGYSGDGGPATAAQLSDPRIAVSGNGTLYITDQGNSRIRRVNVPVFSLTTAMVNAAVNNFRIYPNPAIDLLTIKSIASVPAVTGQTNQVAIINSSGKVVSNTFMGTHETNQVDISGLPAGLYCVRINGAEAGRFVKD